MTLSGFEITRTQDRGINMQTGCADLIVSNNKVSFANSYGIQTVNGQRITITGNTVSDCNFHGIGVTAGATACVVVPRFADRYAAGADWRSLAYWIHDHLDAVGRAPGRGPHHPRAFARQLQRTHRRCGYGP